MTGRLGWPGIVRLGLVQAGLGSLVVLSTSTMNRVMVVELALPAVLPGALVALHYGVQVLRPRMGYGSDMGGRRTPWIVGGMAALAAGAVGAASGTALMVAAFVPGLLLAVVSYGLLGLGVGAAGTSLLTLMAARTDARQRAPAATILWLMMILGIVVTSGVTSRLLDPFSPAHLVTGTARTTGGAVRRGSRISSRPCVKSGPNRRRGALPPSCSSRCWPTAHRKSCSNHSPARCSVSRRARRRG
jgi:BCD family chlorophyll transporter-like MFS transporter